MKNGGDKRLRSLLKRVEIQTPPTTFAGEVMKEIEAMASEKVYADPLLKKMLQKNVSYAPSNEFTYKVLNQIRGQSLTPPPAIIGKKGWSLIVVFFFSCIAIAIFTDTPGDPGQSLRYYLPIAEFVGDLTVQFIEPVAYLAVITLSAGLLLALDYFLGKMRSRNAG